MQTYFQAITFLFAATPERVSDNGRGMMYADLRGQGICTGHRRALGIASLRRNHTVDRYFEGLRMQLRSHPMMNYRGHPNWPPRQWNWMSGADKTESAVGEAGTLEQAQLSRILADTLFLTISTSRGNRFTGQLKFDDDGFALKVLSLLHEHFGKTIKDIAEIEIA